VEPPLPKDGGLCGRGMLRPLHQDWGVAGVTGPGHTRVSRARVAYHVLYILHQITVSGLILSLCLYVIHI
jgi:hypothetical protein